MIVIVGTPFDFRMGYGRRLGKGADVVQIDQDYRTVGKNRDISLGLVGDPGAILGAVAQAASGRADNRAKSRLGLDGGAPGRGAEGDRQADAAVHLRRARRSIPTGSPGRSTSS